MKTALIYGNRICQVENESFPVAEPLFWVDVDDDVQPHTHEWRDGAAVPIPEPEPQEPLIPDRITSVAGKRALLRAGLLDAAIAAIEGIEDELQRRDAQLQWERVEWVRSDPMIQSTAAVLNISESEMDNLFLMAGSL